MPAQAIQVCRDVEAQLLLFLTSTADDRESSAPPTGLFTLGKEPEVLTEQQAGWAKG
jgi:hypothetical protein